MKKEVSVSSLARDDADSHSQSVKTSNDSPSVGRQTHRVTRRVQSEVVTIDALNEFREVVTPMPQTPNVLKSEAALLEVVFSIHKYVCPV